MTLLITLPPNSKPGFKWKSYLLNRLFFHLIPSIVGRWFRLSWKLPLPWLFCGIRHGPGARRKPAASATADDSTLEIRPPLSYTAFRKPFFFLFLLFLLLLVNHGLCPGEEINGRDTETETDRER